jgi:hypothetical protein
MVQIHLVSINFETRKIEIIKINSQKKLFNGSNFPHFEIKTD